jgi:hypothetical protein
MLRDTLFVQKHARSLEGWMRREEQPVYIAGALCLLMSVLVPWLFVTWLRNRLHAELILVGIVVAVLLLTLVVRAVRRKRVEYKRD